MTHTIEILETDTPITKLTITPTRITIKYNKNHPVELRDKEYEYSLRIAVESSHIKNSIRGSFIHDDKTINICMYVDSKKNIPPVSSYTFFK